MTSPEMDLLDTLAGMDEPLAMAGLVFDVHTDPAQFPRAVRALTMQIRDGYIALLRGPSVETAVPVALWELRGVLAVWEHWFPPDSEPVRFWLTITPKGIAYFEGP